MRFISLPTVTILFSSVLPIYALAVEPTRSVPDWVHSAPGAGAPLAEVEAAAAELIETGPASISQAAGPDDDQVGRHADRQLSEELVAAPIMRPIALPKSEDTTGPGDQRLAAGHLPKAVPLEASHFSTSPILPVALKMPPLKDVAPESRVTLLSLNGAVEHEELASKGFAELLEPKEIEATEISGRQLAEPLTLIVSLKDQRLDVYRGLERVETTRVSSGKRGYQTLTGVFGILQKKQEHYSNLYDSAPMPWMQRLTRSGTALHAGEVPNHPASHGCVRVPHDIAPRLFRMTEIGGKVAMLTGPMVVPKRIESPVLVLPPGASGPAEASAAQLVDAGLRAGALAAAGSPKAKNAPSPAVTKAKAEDDRPWHILVTRREERDIAIGTQEALAAMGYLEPQDNFVGYLGSGTRRAIRAFEKDRGLRQRGNFTEKIAAEIYKAAGKGPLPDAYLFLRKGFSRVGHAPVQLSDPKKPLGTHLFTYVHPTDGSEPGWVGMSLEGEDSNDVLNRITIPEDMRAQIADGLRPGASFIVADVAKHSSVLPEGDDFVVRTNDSAKSNVAAEIAKAERRKRAAQQRAAQERKRVAESQQQRRLLTRKRHKSNFRRSAGSPRSFGRFGRR